MGSAVSVQISVSVRVAAEQEEQPGKEKGRTMSTWNSRGLRGSTLEDMVNRTNEQYREKGLALIQKVPTPITPLTIDKESRHITLA